MLYASDYGIIMNVKDKKGNAISDYSNYLKEVVISQNRTGKIASGVAFSVTIDVDLSTYDLIVNYIDKNTNEHLIDSKTEKKKDGDEGVVTCPGRAGYKIEQQNISYKIAGAKVTINCYYIKEEVVDNKPVEPETVVEPGTEGESGNE